ncbi:hypothetical protein E2C01_075853 [Portunus trituberculatus]|uniref:Uncharacterized protein n=1 Tax=Portunus trituberculatus TaxID=210409 RepID=A0A5B7IGV3_PORTR|nr:hypothetical protein [Portunus trituberculatus]
MGRYRKEIRSVDQKGAIIEASNEELEVYMLGTTLLTRSNVMNVLSYDVLRPCVLFRYPKGRRHAQSGPNTASGQAHALFGNPLAFLL